MDVDLLQTFIS